MSTPRQETHFASLEIVIEQPSCKMLQGLSVLQSLDRAAEILELGELQYSMSSWNCPMFQRSSVS